ncbi:molybdopterin-guanine dinucleotide biosynthesis protein A [Halosimplex carlsbadense 2-9-1]|uniref:Molybdopterin-guanine dinucleotide biosynthesis protein A n=1 Tax=Halosimplex carlsbadense 2-9-1 TaxID=797114 RepID=M0D3Z3_9EURY|nr:nucleotidyltransferase family protein [Halosimplex carlsbadense]ELZ28879.1 molybdopterin-guanine dinucleotide biosynthesis protein A [Halosimplex carlsbadense 2-9-1]
MTADSTVAGVLLAAGDSDRFGERNKLLATLDGEPLVRRAARTLTDAEIGPVAAVIDPESPTVGDALAGLDIAVVENPDTTAGQATSVRRGVAWARERADAVVFALGDMPRVAPESVDRLVGAYRDGRGSALAAGCEGRRGNPVLFDGRHFDALAAVEGDTGGRAVFENADDAAVVETGDPGVRVDVDTPGDLDGLR